MPSPALQLKYPATGISPHRVRWRSGLRQAPGLVLMHECESSARRSSSNLVQSAVGSATEAHYRRLVRIYDPLTVTPQGCDAAERTSPEMACMEYLMILWGPDAPQRLCLLLYPMRLRSSSLYTDPGGDQGWAAPRQLREVRLSAVLELTVNRLSQWHAATDYDTKDIALQGANFRFVAPSKQVKFPTPPSRRAISWLARTYSPRLVGVNSVPTPSSSYGL